MGPKPPDALALFSGGLDSILAARTVMDQGLSVLGIHFVTPFFGKSGQSGQLDRWRELYGVEIRSVDISETYCRMLAGRPPHGWGKCFNPCVDCKILMLGLARTMLAEHGAKFLISGEVLGQRPMSQRRDALDVIRKQSGTDGLILRPLCAKHQKPTPMEESGLVDRERLLDIQGRGREPQLRLAREVYRFAEIPTPAGGCKLAEPENAKRYFELFANIPAPGPFPADFRLANLGRQYWAGKRWLTVGRNEADNQALEATALASDILLIPEGWLGPAALVRPLPGAEWDEATLSMAAGLAASHSSKARREGRPMAYAARQGGQTWTVTALPDRTPPTPFADCADWERIKPLKSATLDARTTT